MEGPQRGRSPSGSQQQPPPNHHMNHSPSPRQFLNHLDLDTSIGSATFTSAQFTNEVTAPNRPTDLQYPPSISESPCLPNYSELLIPETSKGFGEFSQHLELSVKQEQQFDRGFLEDPELTGGMRPQQQSINPADIMSTMSSPQNLIPTPPNLMPPDSTTSPRGGSPTPHHGQLYSPDHSRHGSLDPSSAAFGHGQQPADWSSMFQQPQFRHQRAPSEYSDVSSSVAHSPFLAQPEGFDAFDQNPSPLLNPQQDNNHLYPDALGIANFSLSDSQQQQQIMSPRNSPYVSPRMSPQQGLDGPQDNKFLLSHDMHSNFNGGPGPEIYNGQPEAYSPYTPRHGSSDLGQAAQMAPPEINVEFAPTTRQSSFEPPSTENDLDALSPPGQILQD